MKKLQVVIGSNYGDEGKGRTTANLVSFPGGAVVRFNGGAQAGHTVVEGSARHVFSHFGAGTFSGATTILTSDFVCSPHLFKREYEEFLPKSIFLPEVIVSPDCPVTTPWDVLVNQLTEISRGSGRHGSVGVGFGETVERHSINQFRLTVADILLSKKQFLSKMEVIFLGYISVKIANLKGDFTFDKAPWAMDMILRAELVHEQFYQECQYFVDRVTIIDEAEALNKFDHLVFEGAQGLALDQESSDFPHVTRSFTGIDNVIKACEAAKITAPLELFYITRPYLTRHGAGPLKNEVEKLDHFEVVDKTNKPHEFQGSLRFAIQDLDDLASRISKDLAKIPAKRISKIVGVVTCLDQISTEDGKFSTFSNGENRMFGGEQFATEFGNKIQASEMLLFSGECQSKMQKMLRLKWQ